MVFTNLITALTGPSGEFFRSEYATYASIFPHLYVFQISTTTPSNRIQNVVLLASKSDLSKQIASAKAKEPLFNRLWTEKVVTDIPILIDEFAPVEFYASKSFFAH
jgi:hypothetical protein